MPRQLNKINLDASGMRAIDFLRAVNYPVGEEYTQETVGKMQKAESMLESLWRRILAPKTSSDDWTGRYRNLFKENKSVGTPDWIAPFQQQFESKAQSQDAGTGLPERPTGACAHKQYVDARTLRVFQAIFPQSTRSPPKPESIRWNDFFDAMCCIGFSTEGIGFSGWHFWMAEAEQRGPPGAMCAKGIIFFEPHPYNNAKLSQVMMRDIGRRLRRAYALDRETFSLREDDHDQRADPDPTAKLGDKATHVMQDRTFTDRERSGTIVWDVIQYCL